MVSDAVRLRRWQGYSFTRITFVCCDWSRTSAGAGPVSCLCCALLLAGAVSLMGSLLTAPVRAQSPPAQYVTTVWHTEQGLPQNSVNAMLQDHQGYLWIGTFGGLARFDGERFTLFDSSHTPGFGSDRIFSLYESRSGVLWIGTVDGGLIRLQDGVATTYTERDGLPSGFISSIRGDAGGTVWINTSRGVARFTGTELEAYPMHRGKAVREFLLEARDGSMWFRCGDDVVRFGADGSIATLHPEKPSVFLVHEARDGSVWVALRDQYRLVRYYQGVFSDVPLPPVGRRELTGGFPVFSLAMTEDTDGELLLLTPAGLSRIVNGRLGPTEAALLSTSGGETPKVRSFLVDREGNRWVGTIGEGLVRLRRAPLRAYGKAEGLSDSGFSSVFQDREGRVWLGGDLVYWFDGHRFHRLPGVGDILTIAQTRDGDLWFGGYGGLYRYRAGALTHFAVNAPPVRVIFQDREGTVWIGALKEERPGGLYRFHDEKLEQVPGISDVRAIAEDRDGGLWLGSIEGLRWMRGSKTATYDQKQGLSSNAVSDIHLDSTGTLWVATYGGGLTRLREGQFKAITTKDGLPDNIVLGILEDASSNLWLSSNHGIFRLTLKDLNDFADGKISVLSPVSYGVAEGMRSSESNGGSPGGWRTTDGRIWFPTLRGAVAIDPTADNRLPPRVIVEEAWANDRALARDGMTSVPAGNNTFDFRFTALSFSAPEKLQFKYRLEPFEKDWVDARTRRTAHYTNMDPGEYRFQVIAANNYGVWNDQGVSVQFVLKPHFYQTNWFRVLCALAVLALAWAAHRMRVQLLKQQEEDFRDAVESMPVQAFLSMPNGDAVFVNRRWTEYTGLTLEQAAGSGWQATIHPDDLKRISEQFRVCLANDQPVEYECRGRRWNGEYRWFLVRAVPVHDKRGKVVKWCGAATDIEDRKRAEQLQADLAHVTRVSTLGELAASLAHEIKQPIAATIASASSGRLWLEREQPNLDKAIAALGRIEKDGNRAASIIDRLRALYKKAPPQRELLAVNDVIVEMAGLLRGEAIRYAVSIRTDLASGIPEVMADRVQIQQVLMNLMLNGIEAMKDMGGVLTVSSQPGQDGQVLISVSDTGVGLSAEKADQIFEAFFTTKAQGSGMGLAISRSIVESHGGHLWASANDGRGATFHFTLPVAADTRQVVAAGAQADDSEPAH